MKNSTEVINVINVEQLYNSFLKEKLEIESKLKKKGVNVMQS